MTNFLLHPSSQDVLVVNGFRGSLTTANAMTISNNAASFFDLGSSFCGPLSVAQNLRIVNNTALEHLSCAFSKLEIRISSIAISDNPALASVSGLCTSAFMAASDDAVTITNSQVCCTAAQNVFSQSLATPNITGCTTTCTPAALNAICACDDHGPDLCPSHNHCQDQFTNRCSDCAVGKAAVNYTACVDCAQLHGPYCLACDPSSCTACSASVIINNGACEECPNGQYVQTSTSCAACTSLHGSFCQSCDIHACTACDASVTRINDQCVECPMGQYAFDETTCTNCASVHGRYCEVCSKDACEKCDVSVTLMNGTCTDCPNGQYAFNQSFCEDCTQAHGVYCQSCHAGSCETCDDSVFLNDGQCTECPWGQYASNETTCSECSDLHGAFCQVCQAGGCSQCDESVILVNGTCLECPESQYANTSLSCAACSEVHGDECLSCSQSECLSCNSSSALQAGSCTLCSGLHGAACTHCNESSCLECESVQVLFKNRCREPCNLSCQHGSSCELLDETPDSPPPHQHCRCSPHFSGELCQTPAIGLDTSVSASQLDQPVAVSSSLVLAQGLTVDQVALDSLRISDDSDSLILLFNSSLPFDQGSQASLAFSFTTPDRVAISFIPLSSFWPDSRGSLTLDFEASLLVQGQSLTTNSNTTNNDTNTMVTFESVIAMKTQVVMAETSDNSTISGGAVAGIVVGVVAGLMLFCFLFRRYRDKNPRTSPSSSNNPDALEMKGVAL